MLIGRLLALGLSAFLVVVGVATMPESVVGAQALITLGGLPGLLVLASFFRKQEVGQLPEHVQDLTQLTHEDIASFSPYITIPRGPEDRLVGHTVVNAMAAPEERVIVRSYARANEVLCLLVVTNRRYVLYRISNLAFVGRIVLNLIHKIPFGGIVAWPFEGMVYAWLQVFQSERKALLSAMQVRDDVLMTGKVQAWKTLRHHSFAELHQELESITIKPSWWSGGISIGFVPRRMRKAFSFTDLNLSYPPHLPVVRALFLYAAPYLTSAWGWSLAESGKDGLELKAPEAVAP